MSEHRSDLGADDEVLNQSSSVIVDLPAGSKLPEIKSGSVNRTERHDGFGSNNPYATDLKQRHVLNYLMRNKQQN